MRKWMWTMLVAVPLAAAGGLGLVYANSQAQSYTCPITGEQLPCPNCCPLNGGKQQDQEASSICPVTGEELPCEKCCPLNKSE